MHAKQLRHRAVHVLVFDEKGAVFLQKRSMGKDSCPGTWDSSCSGHLDAGEDYDAAAVRDIALVAQRLEMVRRLQQAAQGYSVEQLKAAYRLCIDTEFQIKSGQLAEEGSLEQLVLRLIHLKHQAGKRPHA